MADRPSEQRVPRGIPDPLAGVRAKIDRAVEHLEALHREIDDFRHGDTYVVTDYFDRERSSYIFRIDVIEQPPLQWGVVVGELVHDFRSALDHAVWQLIKANGRRPRGNSAYPILRTEPDEGFGAFALGTAKYPGPLRGVSSDALAFIKGTQPYHGGNYRLLGVLNQIWGADKHRFLVPTFVLLRAGVALTSHYTRNEDAGPTLEIRAGDPNTATESSAELAVIGLTPTGPNPKVEMHGHPPIDIAFGGGPAVIDVLREVSEFLITGVFSPLEGFFP